MSSAYRGTKRLINEHPNWLPILETALECAKEHGEFCGNWVRKRMERKLKKKVWFPGLRMLVRYGILKHVETTRGGRRAYYTMPDQQGVEKALRESALHKSKN